MELPFEQGFEKMSSFKGILKSIIPGGPRSELAGQIKKTRKLRDTYSKSSRDVDSLYQKTKKEYPGSNALDRMRDAKKGFEAKKEELNSQAKELLKSASLPSSLAKKLGIKYAV